MHICLSGTRASLQQACASLCKHALLKAVPGKMKAQACASMHKLAKRFQMHACASLHRQARSKRATSMPQAWTSLPKGSKCILAQACKRSMHMLAASLQNKLAILVWIKWSSKESKSIGF